VFQTPALPDGQHTIVVEINDGKNFKGDTRTVTVKQGAPPLPDQGDPLENDVVGGCAVSGQDGSAFAALALLVLTARRRRDPRRLRR
jgi:MYXO-CTERM domain-containing protein